MTVPNWSSSVSQLEFLSLAIRLCVVAFGICAPAHVAICQPGTALLAGTVSDSLTGSPLTLVSVQIEGTTLTTMTDSEGHFAIADVPLGFARLRVQRVGYQAVSRFVVTTASRMTNLGRIPMSVQPGCTWVSVVVTGLGDPWGSGLDVRVNLLAILRSRMSALKVNTPFTPQPDITAFLPARPVR